MSNGGQILVESLIALGATKSFGVPGESYLAVLDALHDAPGSLDYIPSRHEDAAALRERSEQVPGGVVDAFVDELHEITVAPRTPSAPSCASTSSSARCSARCCMCCAIRGVGWNR